MKESYKERYAKRDRCIFRYFNGAKDIATDPIAAQRKLLGAPIKEYHFETDVKLMQIEKDDGVLALGRVLDATRYAFKLAPFEESDDGEQHGVTDSEVLTVFMDFAFFVDDLKKKSASIVTKPNSTEPLSSEENQASPCLPDATSTGTAALSDELPAFRPELAQPSEALTVAGSVL